jgi:hypothetical protein
MKNTMVDIGTPERRRTAAALAELEQVIERMDSLGAAAEDAAARITQALSETVITTTGAHREQLLTAIGDVIDIVSERSRLAHRAHRLIVAIRARDVGAWTCLEPPCAPSGERLS